MLPGGGWKKKSLRQNRCYHKLGEKNGARDEPIYTNRTFNRGKTELLHLNPDFSYENKFIKN